MQTPYKIEIFDRNIDFKSMTPMGAVKFSFDYLTLEKTKITIPKIEAAKGDFAHITDFYGNIIYQGIIDDYTEDNNKCSLSIKPLLSLFDIRIFYDRTALEGKTLENHLKDIISDVYINNDDDLQNIPMSITVTSSTNNAKLNRKSNVGELYNIILAALSGYGVIVNATLNPQEKEIAVTIGTVSTDIVIEADKDNVLDKNFVIGDGFGAVNKLTLINENDEGEKVTYYLHTDGTVSDVDTNRIWPVFASVEYINDNDFEEAAEKRAVEALTPQQYDNLIELTYRKEDRLIDVNIPIGSSVTILNNGNTYSSILTGREWSGDTVTLVFGIVRVDLIKKLISQKRTPNYGITASNIGLGNVTNNAQVKKIASSTENNIVTWGGSNGDTPKDSGFSINATMVNRGELPSNANFNNYILPAIYTFGDSSNHTNGPGFSWGVLIVYPSTSESGYKVQVAYNIITKRSVYRTYYSGAWTAWEGHAVTRTAKQTSNVNNSSNTNPSDVTGLAFPVYNGTRYMFRFVLQGSSAATGTGIGFCFSGPSMTFSHFKIKNEQASAGTDQFYENTVSGSITTVLVSASVVAANTDYWMEIEGICQPSESGTLQLRCRSEVNGSQITVKNGCGVIYDC